MSVLSKILALAFDKRTPEQEAVAAFLKARRQLPDNINVDGWQGTVTEKIVYRDRVVNTGNLRYAQEAESVGYALIIHHTQLPFVLGKLSNWSTEPYFKIKSLWPDNSTDKDVLKMKRQYKGKLALRVGIHLQSQHERDFDKFFEAVVAVASMED